MINIRPKTNGGALARIAVAIVLISTLNFFLVPVENPLGYIVLTFIGMFSGITIASMFIMAEHMRHNDSRINQ